MMNGKKANTLDAKKANLVKVVNIINRQRKRKMIKLKYQVQE